MTTRSEHSCRLCAIRPLNFFCELSKAASDQIDLAKTRNNYKPHQVVFYEESTATGLYCIATGRVKIFKTTVDGNHKILRVAGPGDVIGYRALITGESYQATAETIEESRICFVDKDTFLNILQSEQRTAINVMTALASTLGTAQNNELSLTHRSVKQRFAEMLLLLRKKFGTETPQGCLLKTGLSRQEFADLIGTTQESVIRVISDLKKQELITVDKREITLLDLPAIVDLADIAH